MNRKIRLALVVTASIALAACGGGSSSSSSDAGDEPAASTPIEAVELSFQPIAAGKLTVCSDVPYEPFEYQDSAGKWTGFDMDLMSDVAARYGLTMEVSKQPFDSILVAVNAGTCDVVASSVTITEERAKNVLFSDPYFDADQSLLVRKEDESTIVDIATLAGKTVAVQSGTTGEIYAKENITDKTTKVQSFEDASAMFLALESKQVDAVLQDFPINAFRAVKQKTTVVTGKFTTNEKYGFAVALKNEDLQAAINESLNEFTSQGIYDEIFAKYFGAQS